MEIKQIKTEDLVQDGRNFNKGTAKGERLMTKSLRELGAGRGILVDKNGNIIAGNKTQLAAIKAGIKKAVVVQTEGDALVVTQRTDIDINTKKGRELALADNATTEANLCWDIDEIQQACTDFSLDVDEWGIDIDGLGIQESTEEPVPDDDNFNPDSAKVKAGRCKAGDIWVLGEHRLMCGDSTSREDIQALMDGEICDLWLTDPPYNVAIQGGTRDKLTIMNDSMSSTAFADFLHKAFAAAESVMRPGAAFYVWFASCEHENFEHALNDCGLHVRQELIWSKNVFTLGRQDYQWRHESCLYGWKEGAAHKFIGLRNLSTVIDETRELDIDSLKAEEAKRMLHRILDDVSIHSTVLEYDKPIRSADHPTMKPVPLFGFQMRNSTQPGDIVLDSFGGSGTTLVAAESLGRKARIMELDPHYCDVILSRWETLTGDTARRA